MTANTEFCSDEHAEQYKRQTVGRLMEYSDQATPPSAAEDPIHRLGRLTVSAAAEDAERPEWQLQPFATLAARHLSPPRLPAPPESITKPQVRLLPRDVLWPLDLEVRQPAPAPAPVPAAPPAPLPDVPWFQWMWAEPLLCTPTSTRMPGLGRGREHAWARLDIGSGLRNRPVRGVATAAGPRPAELNLALPASVGSGVRISAAVLRSSQSCMADLGPLADRAPSAGLGGFGRRAPWQDFAVVPAVPVAADTAGGLAMAGALPTCWHPLPAGFQALSFAPLERRVPSYQHLAATPQDRIAQRQIVAARLWAPVQKAIRMPAPPPARLRDLGSQVVPAFEAPPLELAAILPPFRHLTSNAALTRTAAEVHRPGLAAPARSLQTPAVPPVSLSWAPVPPAIPPASPLKANLLVSQPAGVTHTAQPPGWNILAGLGRVQPATPAGGLPPADCVSPALLPAGPLPAPPAARLQLGSSAAWMELTAPAPDGLPLLPSGGPSGSLPIRIAMAQPPSAVPERLTRVLAPNMVPFGPLAFLAPQRREPTASIPAQPVTILPAATAIQSSPLMATGEAVRVASTLAEPVLHLSFVETHREAAPAPPVSTVAATPLEAPIPPEPALTAEPERTAAPVLHLPLVETHRETASTPAAPEEVAAPPLPPAVTVPPEAPIQRESAPAPVETVEQLPLICLEPRHKELPPPRVAKRQAPVASRMGADAAFHLGGSRKPVAATTPAAAPVAPDPIAPSAPPAVLPLSRLSSLETLVLEAQPQPVRELLPKTPSRPVSQPALDDAESVRDALDAVQKTRPKRSLQFGRVAFTIWHDLVRPFLAQRRGKAVVGAFASMLLLFAGFRGENGPLRLAIGSALRPVAARAHFQHEENFTRRDVWTNPVGIQLTDDGLAQIPEGVTLHRPSQGRLNYEFSFAGLIRQGALGWAVRAANPENYYAFKLTWRGKGKERRSVLVRHTVVNGGPTAEKVVAMPFEIEANKVYNVQVTVNADRVTTVVDGRGVDSYSDSRLTSGGVGFLADPKETALVHSLTVAGNEDTTGRFLAWTLGYFGFVATKVAGS